MKQTNKLTTQVQEWINKAVDTFEEVQQAMGMIDKLYFDEMVFSTDEEVATAEQVANLITNKELDIEKVFADTEQPILLSRVIVRQTKIAIDNLL